MKVHLAKWGNSLAVRIPGECARQAHVKAGDALEIEVTSDRRSALATDGNARPSTKRRL
jgi:antitoxin component of MazEF toxin-antitoxin module